MPYREYLQPLFQKLDIKMGFLEGLGIPVPIFKSCRLDHSRSPFQEDPGRRR